jgi:protein involved in polysaccharide export with SLBB domain
MLTRMMPTRTVPRPIPKCVPLPRLSLSGGLGGLVLLGALAALLGAGAAQASDYRLGPQDRLRLRVYEWRATQDQLFEWEALNDEFIVGADGAVSLPVAGEVPAAGFTSAEIAKAISERIKSRLGMHDAPDTAVEVIQFRPFYIVGQVEKPGEYPYRPGLTVLQALSIGGGLLKISDLGLLRLQRDAIASQGELAVLGQERDSLLVRQARLESERKGVEILELPPALKARQSNPALALIIQQETQIFQARWQAFKTQTEALEQLKVFLEREIVSLEAQIATHDTQIKLVMKELQSVTTLVERGLSAAPRQLNLERTIAQIQGDRLRMESTLLKARQEISRANISILELRNGRMNEITVEARATSAKLDEVLRKAETSGRLLREAEFTAPRFVLERARAARAQPTFTIIRVVNGRTETIPADEGTSVAPGDALKVDMPRGLDEIADLIGGAESAGSRAALDQAEPIAPPPTAVGPVTAPVESVSATKKPDLPKRRTSEPANR